MLVSVTRVLFLGPCWQVDDGEPLRKAALSCIDTILDSLPNKLDVATLMPYLAKVILHTILGIVLYFVTGYGMVCGLVWIHGTVWCDVVWCGMV